MTDNTAAVGVATPEQMRATDGLGFLRAMIAGAMPKPPIAETLGFTLSEADEGRAVFTGTPAFAFYNPINVVHGGWAATLLDSALGCAVHTTLARGEGYTTLELKVNMVRAITADTGPMTSEGRILHRGRTMATAEAYLRDAAGKLYAHGTTTCMVFPAKG